MASINDLPNEILLKIFTLLPQKKRLTRTCHRWNELIACQLHLSIDLGNLHSVKQCLEVRITRSYRKLTIKGVMLLSQKLFNWRWIRDGYVPPKQPRLDDGFDHYVIIKKFLEIVRQCEHNLIEMHLEFGPSTDKILLQFLPRVRTSRLERLSIVFNDWDLEKPDQCIINKLEYLTKDAATEVGEMPRLNLVNLIDKRPAGDRNVRCKFFNTMIRNARGMEELNLECTHYPCFQDFRLIRSFSRQLRRITLSIWPNFANELFELRLPRLEYLSLNWFQCQTVPDVAYEFFQRLTSLVELVVENVQDANLYKNGIYKCSSLEKLSICGRQEVPMEGLHNLRCLKELQLLSSQQCYEQMTVPQSPSVQKLTLDRCTAGVAFYSILSVSLPNLTELTISGDELFDDECLQVICQSMVNLQRLSLTVMTFVEDPVTAMGFVTIKNLKKLQYLTLELFDGGYFTPQRDLYPLFDEWVQQLRAEEVHLKGFKKFQLHNLLDFLLNPYLKCLTLDQCGKSHRMVDGLSKIRALVGDSRPLPRIVYNSGW